MARAPRPRTSAVDDTELGAIIARELARAEGGNEDELQANRRQALDYYFARPRGDEVLGRSQVISTDVADMVNAVLAMIVPMISTDAVVEFEPLSLEDEPAAAMESDAVNKIILEDCQGFVRIQEAVKDALLLRNGCLKVLVEDDDDVEVIQLPDGLERAQLGALEEPRQPGETRSINGNELTITRRQREFRLYAVAIENMSWRAGWSGPLARIPFIAERIPYTRSELVEMGAPRETVDELQPTTVQPTASLRDEPGVSSEAASAETRDQDVIDCQEVYILVDRDGDGISERWKVLVANDNKVLAAQPFDLIPYAIGSPFLNPHRLTGESLFDHLKATQDTKTGLTRQLLDNITVINNGRYAYDPSMTNEEDVLTPRAGGGIRARNPTMALVPIVIPDVTSGILAGLQYEDMRRAERGGSALDLLRPDRQVVSETAAGTERQMGNREALASMMAANLAESMIREAYALMHEFLRRYSDRPLMVRQSGQYIEVDPRQWPRRTRLNVTMGMSPGARGHMEQALLMHQQLQLAAVQAGAMGVLVDPGTIYRTAVERLRAAGIPNPERHMVDPSSPAAQQAAQAAQQQGQAAQQAQAQMAERALGIEEGKVQVQRQNKVDELELDARKAEAELRFDYHELAVKTEAEEASQTAEAVVDLEKERRKQAHELRKQRMAGEQAIAVESKRTRRIEGLAAGAGDGGE